MKENKVFYQCKSIYEQLTLVMREILSKELKEVIINIPRGEDISKILIFFEERKFKYTFDDNNKQAPIIRISENIIEESEIPIFYISYEKFINKSSLFNGNNFNNDIYSCVMFRDLESEIMAQIQNNNCKINSYGIENMLQTANKNIEENNTNINEEVILENHLVNEQIRNKFLETFFIAKKEIDIASPWISNDVVDKELINLMEYALRNKVKIKILYGIGDDERTRRTDEMAAYLLHRFSKYNELFIMRKTNTHYKILICDDKYAISGSYNFLSFRGDYNGKDDRGEGAEYIDNKEMILNRRKYYFDF